MHGRLMMGLIAGTLAIFALTGTATAQRANFNQHSKWAKRYLAPAQKCPGAAPTAPRIAAQHGLRCLINWARTRAHAPALRNSVKLDRASVIQVKPLSNGKPLSNDVFDKVGYLVPGGRVAALESVGAFQTPRPDYASSRATLASWVNDASFRVQLLSDDFTDLGVAVAPEKIHRLPGNAWVVSLGAR